MSNFKNYLNTYVFETELPGSGQTVSFKPVTTGQIKKLLLYETSQDPLSIEDALDEMITECVVKPEGFSSSDLYLQDRFYLLVEIRKATRGNQYSFQTTCSQCNSQTQHIIKLSDLTVKKLDKKTKKIEKTALVVKRTGGKLVEKKNVITTNPTIEPVDGWNVVKLNDLLSVKLDVVTRNMQKEAVDLFNEKYKETEINDVRRTIEVTTTLYALAIQSIISPDGEEADLSIDEKIFLLDNIQQTEQEKITKWFDDNDFGIDFSFDLECIQCHNKERKAVPVENFFY